MALNDLTGQNIQETYQRVVQTDGTNLADGTGSLLPISIDGNDVTISGSLTANEYIVSSSVTNITVATLSGSTNFGDDNADTHKFTGSLNISGNLTFDTITNSIKGIYFQDTGTKIQGDTNYLHIDGDNQIDLVADNNIFITSPNTSTNGNISASGYVYGNRLYVNDNIAAASPSSDKIRFAYDSGVDFVEYGKDSNTSHFFYGSAITASGDISSSATSNLTIGGTATANTGSFHYLKGDTTKATGLSINGTITASGDISSSGALTCNGLHAKNTDLGAGISLYDADDNAIANLARIGSGGNAHIGRMVLRDNANVKVDIRATGNSYINGTSAKLGIGTDSPGQELTVHGTISSSGLIIGSRWGGHLTASGDVIATNVSASGYIQTGTIRPYNGIAGSGHINIINGVNFASLQHPTAVIQVYGGTQFGGAAGHVHKFTGQVSMSGNLSASGNLVAEGNISGALSSTGSFGRANAVGTVNGSHIFGVDGNIGECTFAGGAATIAVGNIETVSAAAIVATSTISASGAITGYQGLTAHAITGTTDGEGKGDVLYFGNTASMTAGAIYHLNSSGNWELADADDNTKCDGLLGVALGAASNIDGVLIRGMVTLDHDPGAMGDVLYLTTTAGDASATAPSSNGNIVRIIGYCLDATNGQIWFDPDKTFVEVSA